MWQMAAVLEFLHTFSLYLQLRGSFTPEELEVALVSETAQTGLLANLHQVTCLPCAQELCIPFHSKDSKSCVHQRFFLVNRKDCTLNKQ